MVCKVCKVMEEHDVNPTAGLLQPKPCISGVAVGWAGYGGGGVQRPTQLPRPTTDTYQKESKKNKERRSQVNSDTNDRDSNSGGVGGGWRGGGGGGGGGAQRLTPLTRSTTDAYPALLLLISNPTLELCSYRYSISRDPACLQIGTEGMCGRAEPNHDEDQ